MYKDHSSTAHGVNDNGKVGPISPNPMLFAGSACTPPPTSVVEADPMQVLHALLRFGTLVSFVLADSSQAPPEAELLHNIELLRCLVVVDAIRIICRARPSGWDISNIQDASDLKQSSIRSIMNVLANSVQGFFNLTSSTSQARDVETKSASGRSQLIVDGAFNYPTQLINQVRRLVVPSILLDLDKNLTAHNLVIHYTLEKNGPGLDGITMSCHIVTVVQQKGSGHFKLHIDSIATEFQMVWDGKNSADIRSLIQRLVRPDGPDAVDVDSIMTMLQPIIVQ